MSSKLLSTITNAYALVLDKRIGYWKELRESFQSKGINLQLFLSGDGHLQELYSYGHIDHDILPPIYPNGIQYETWYKTPNPMNCWLAQKKILQRTLMDGLDHVLLIEDDSIIEEDFDEVLSKAEPFFQDNKWDAIYFGAYHNPNSWEPTNNEAIIRLKGSGGFHGVLLTKRLIEDLVEVLPIGPLDWQMGYFHNIYDCFAIYPSIISQKSGFSYIENSPLTKPSRYHR